MTSIWIIRILFIGGAILLLWVMYVDAKNQVLARREKRKQITIRDEAQVINNRATIHTQNNYAKNLTVNNNHKTIYQKPKGFDRSEYDRIMAKYGMTPTLDTITDISNNVKNNDSMPVDNDGIKRQIMPVSRSTKPNDAMISRVIRKKVYDKTEQVLALRDENPSYIARKVFHITGGGSRMAYIAAIIELIESEKQKETF